MVKPISREDEANIPAFSSHDEAIKYFKEKYGSDLLYEEYDSDCYFFCLILDHEAFRRGRNAMAKGKPLTGDAALSYIHSYQPIQIFDNGNVHIVH